MPHLLAAEAPISTRIRHVALAGVMLLGASVGARADAVTPPAAIAAAKKIVICADIGSPPLSFYDASGKTVMHLFEDEDGAYDTDPNVTPRFYMLPPDDAAGNGGENDAGD